MKKYKSILTLLLTIILLNCGGKESGGSVRIVINGQTHELALTNSRCFAGQPSGDGIYNLPISCSAAFANTSGLADQISVQILDARAVNDALGVIIPISPSLLIMSFTLDGTQLAISSGAAVFSSISNLSGGETSFTFQLETAQAHIEGNFTGSNAVGF